MITIEETGMENVRVLMNYALSDSWKRSGLKAGAGYFRQQLRVEPRPKPRKNPYLTRKQRIYLAIAYREGRLKYPYKRTGEMSEAWDITEETPLSVLVHNPTRAARYTMGMQRSRYNKETGWQDMPEKWRRHSRGTIDAANDEVERLFRARN